MDRDSLLVSWLPLDLQQRLVTSTAIVIAVLLVVFYWGPVRRRDSHRIPGPRPWPIIGNLNLLGPVVHQDFHKLAQKYGPIFRLRLGSKETIIVSSPRFAEEILKTHDVAFASRPKISQLEILFYGSQSISAAPYGPYWRCARKVFTVELMTNKRIQQFQNAREEEVLVGLHSILERCKDGRVVTFYGPEFAHVAMNSTTRMSMNRTFFGPNATNLDEATLYKETMDEFVRYFSTFDIGDFIPFLKPFDLQGNRKRMRAVVKKNDIFFDKIMEDRRRLRSSEQSNIQEEKVMDFLDVLLTRSTIADEKPLTDAQIKGILLDVLVSGSESTVIMVEWAMAEMLKHPAVLKKAQDELDVVVGRDRLVEETDIPRLKYISCIFKETMRLHPPGPILVPHECMESREVAGYLIPVKSQVFVNVYAIARDPEVWERPLEFYPERFLSTNIDVLGQDFQLLPFGSGRRSCPAKNLAVVSVEYMLALLLQACDWALPAGVSPEDVDLAEAHGVTSSKKVHLEAIATPRLPKDVIYADKKAP